MEKRLESWTQKGTSQVYSADGRAAAVRKVGKLRAELVTACPLGMLVDPNFHLYFSPNFAKSVSVTAMILV